MMVSGWLTAWSCQHSSTVVRRQKSVDDRYVLNNSSVLVDSIDEVVFGVGLARDVESAGLGAVG